MKNVFYCTEMNQYMRVLRQIKLKRSQVLKYFSKLVASDAHAVVQLDPCAPVGAGLGDGAHKSPSGSVDGAGAES